MIYVSQPVDKAAVLADKERMREVIYTFGCYCENLQFTLADVQRAFGYRRDRVWSRIQELKRAGRVVSLPETRNRSLVYAIATAELSQ